MGVAAVALLLATPGALIAVATGSPVPDETAFLALIGAALLVAGERPPRVGG